MPPFAPADRECRFAVVPPSSECGHPEVRRDGGNCSGFITPLAPPGANARYERPRRPSAPRSAWPPTARPIWASSPAAWMAVPTISAPEGERPVSSPAGGANPAGGIRRGTALGAGRRGGVAALGFDRAPAFALVPARGLPAVLARAAELFLVAALARGSGLAFGALAAAAAGADRRALRRWGRVRGRLERTSCVGSSGAIGHIVADGARRRLEACQISPEMRGATGTCRKSWMVPAL